MLHIRACFRAVLATSNDDKTSNLGTLISLVFIRDACAKIENGKRNVKSKCVRSNLTKIRQKYLSGNHILHSIVKLNKAWPSHLLTAKLHALEAFTHKQMHIICTTPHAQSENCTYVCLYRYICQCYTIDQIKPWHAII